MKRQITVRLEESVLEKLSYNAAQTGLNRQSYVEKILTDSTETTQVPDSTKFIPYVSPMIIEQIHTQSGNLDAGTEISLKELVGHPSWDDLDDTTRKIFGKQFKEMVNDGEFNRLSVGRKKSNNEQQYDIS